MWGIFKSFHTYLKLLYQVASFYSIFAMENPIWLGSNDERTSRGGMSRGKIIAPSAPQHLCSVLCSAGCILRMLSFVLLDWVPEALKSCVFWSWERERLPVSLSADPRRASHDPPEILTLFRSKKSHMPIFDSIANKEGEVPHRQSRLTDEQKVV